MKRISFVRRRPVVVLALTLAAAAALPAGAAHALVKMSTHHRATPPTKKVAAVAKMPTEHVMAPNFTLTDSTGKRRRLSDFRGHPVALCFFCDCQWCHAYARVWSPMQRGGALPTGADGNPPKTVVVFDGDAATLNKFAADTGLDMSQTVLLSDLTDDMHVTLDLYNSEPCPRIFVLDSKGFIKYANVHKDDKPHDAPEKIASRVLDALRAISTVKPASSAAP